jgi:L-lactate dehydrogenase complex protein LldG
MPESTDKARAAILGRIGRANTDANPLLRAAEYAGIARNYQRSSQNDRAAILELFSERLRDYDAVVRECGPDAVADTIDAALAANGQESIVAAAGFPREWVPRAHACSSDAGATVETLSRAEGALVGCEVAVAHTGTIVLKDVRRLTLLPDRLLCVVSADQVAETVPEAIERLQPLARDALTFISGPSATADIEMTRIRGVHGPRFLDVVLVRPGL